MRNDSASKVPDSSRLRREWAVSCGAVAAGRGSVLFGCVGIAQRPPRAAEVGGREGVVPVEVDVPTHVRRQARDVGVEHGVPGRA